MDQNTTPIAAALKEFLEEMATLEEQYRVITAETKQPEAPENNA